jgi:hypothetical protein
MEKINRWELISFVVAKQTNEVESRLYCSGLEAVLEASKFNVEFKYKLDSCFGA